MSEYKIQTPGNQSKERMRNSQQGESLKSRVSAVILLYSCKFVLMYPHDNYLIDIDVEWFVVRKTKK